ncbi:MAG: four helix bundle protein [Candidatus Parcubacteria bacterium]|nr:four helix bundle protein [Candidatus Parcubacteria bacterium]
MENKYLKLEDLDVYKISIDLSRIGWIIFENLNSEQKYIFGRQFITAIDSIGANVAEGYGRYHYLDKAKFYYNARASLFEAKHWCNLLFERKIIDQEKYEELIDKLNLLNAKLNNLIKNTKDKK